MKRLILILFLILSCYSLASAEEKIVFSGIPVFKISEGGVERFLEELEKAKSLNSKCTITKIDNKYFWTTRENVQMIRIESGAYTTFVAEHGGGYVRIISPEMKKKIPLIDQTEEKFDYVEHLLIGLKSVTYYGVSLTPIK